MLRVVVGIATLIVVALLVRANTLVSTSSYLHVSKLRALRPTHSAEAFSEEGTPAAAEQTGTPQLDLLEAYVPPQARSRAAVAAAEVVASEAAEIAARTAASCPATRKPYHVVMTAATGRYQEWQSRIAYYHYQKQVPQVSSQCNCERSHVDRYS